MGLHRCKRNAIVNLGVNLGLGAQLFTKDNFRLFAEGKYIISELDRFVLSVGMLLIFKEYLFW